MTIRPHYVRGVRYWLVDLGVVDGKRRRRVFSTRAGADRFAVSVRDARAALGDGPLIVSPAEWGDYVAARTAAAAAGLSVRNAVIQAVRAATTPGVTLGAAIESCLAAKRAANRRETYLRSLEDALQRFARGRDGTALASIGPDEVNTALERFGPSSRATVLNRLSTLFSHAVRSGWLPSNPCDRIERPTIDQRPPAILTPAQVRTALTWTRKETPAFVPWLVLGVFAGCRPEESDRIGWDAIDLDRGLCRVEHSKVRMRRLVDLHPTAAAWLRLGGRLPVPNGTRRRWQRELRTVLELDAWPKDVLRHTAASHLLALHNDAAKVALWLGNSPAVLLRHYRELITPVDNEIFWNVKP